MYTRVWCISQIPASLDNARTIASAGLVSREVRSTLMLAEPDHPGCKALRDFDALLALNSYKNSRALTRRMLGFYTFSGI